MEEEKLTPGTAMRNGGGGTEKTDRQNIVTNNIASKSICISQFHMLQTQLALYHTKNIYHTKKTLL